MLPPPVPFPYTVTLTVPLTFQSLTLKCVGGNKPSSNDALNSRLYACVQFIFTAICVWHAIQASFASSMSVLFIAFSTNVLCAAISPVSVELVVKLICTKCGEEWYPPGIPRMIEGIREAVKRTGQVKIFENLKITGEKR